MAVLGLVGGAVVSCHKVDEAPKKEEDPYDLLCDEKQTALLSKAVDGLSSNRVKIAERVSQRCQADVQFCPPAGFKVEDLDRSVFASYPLACLGESHSMVNAGAITMVVPPSDQIVVAFTPRALDESSNTSCALSGTIAHEFGHVLSGQVLGHDDITIPADEAPVDWIYALGHAAEFVCDGADSDAKQLGFLQALQQRQNDGPFIFSQLPKLEAARSDMRAAEGRLGCATASTMHMLHVCSIFDQRIASLSGTIGAYEAALSAVQR